LACLTLSAKLSRAALGLSSRRLGGSHAKLTAALICALFSSSIRLGGSEAKLTAASTWLLQMLLLVMGLGGSNACSTASLTQLLMQPSAAQSGGASACLTTAALLLWLGAWLLSWLSA
jgi:hypothetical protein